MIPKQSYHTYIVIVLFAFILYGNTILNDYALDDAIVITENTFTKKGIHGIKDILSTDSFTGFFGKQKKLVTGGRYRPLSMVTFAIEYEFFGKNPHISHLVNILLLALTGILLFNILSKLLKNVNPHKWYFSIPFAATMLFLAHPLHTEVIANIKGRDEILTFSGALIALYYSLKYLEFKNNKYLFYIFIYFFLALLAKENTFTFVLVIPLCIYFFAPYFSRKKITPVFSILAPLISAAILFLIIRTSIMGINRHPVPDELMNNPFLHVSSSDKYASIIYTFGVYLKLLFFPHPLTYDYYPYHIPILNWANYKVILSFIINLVLIIVGVCTLRKKSILSFSILFYFITFSIVSNIFFPIGAFMNERFMYIPSLAFCLLLACFIVSKLPVYLKLKRNTWGILLIGIILILYSFKTIDRNKDWKNDFTLFTTDVRTSFNSAKSNCSAGGKLIEEAKKINDIEKKEAYIKQGVSYLEKAIEIYPTYTDALLLLGNVYFEQGKNYQKTWACYKKILTTSPYHEKVYNNIEAIFNQVEDVDFKIKVYLELLQFSPKRFESIYRLGVLYGKYKNNFPESIKYLEKAIEIKPGDYAALKDLGVAYGMNRSFKKAIDATEKALKINPDDPELYINMGVSYQQLGDAKKAGEYFKKASEIKASL